MSRMPGRASRRGTNRRRRQGNRPVPIPSRMRETAKTAQKAGTDTGKSKKSPGAGRKGGGKKKGGVNTLYTVMPLELIFAEEIEPPEEETVNGVAMMYRRGADGKRYLNRIVSTDLSDYLKYSVF